MVINSDYYLTKRLWTFTQSRNARRIIISFPYDPQWVQVVKTIPDRKYDPASQTWSIPARQLNITLKSLDINHIPYQIDDEKIKSTADKVAAFESSLLDIKFDESVTLPPIIGLKTTPRPYQYQGIVFLSTVKCGILAWDMGVGKTITSLAASLYLGLESILILCPSTLKWHWQREIQKHTDCTSTIIHGTPATRAKQWQSDSRFFICSYGSALNDAAHIEAIKWDGIIADEVTRIKSHKAQRTKFVKSIKAKYKFALTGRPIENNLEELHSIIDWCQPGILGSLYFFLDRYAIKNWFGSVVGYKPEGIKEVRKIIGPYLLKRDKLSEYRGKPILPDLPEKLPPIDLMVEFTPAERREYKALAKEIMEMIESDFMNPMTRVLRCRQYTTSPKILGFEFDGPKVREIQNLLEEGDGHKFLFFSEFIPLVKMIGTELNVPYMTGDTPQDERQKLIDNFNADENQKALICSNVAGYGVEITGADVVVHVDTPWNPGTKDQREDRVWRPGQKRAVKVIRLRVIDSVDDRVEKVIQSKMKLAHQVLDDDFDLTEAIKKVNITKADWRKILLD